LSKKFKKYSLKVEFLNLELEERDELFKEYNTNFNRDFRREIQYLNSIKKQEKKNNSIENTPKPKPSKLSQKIYRNLAKILHPDVSKVNDAESIFKTITDYYENDNLIGLISAYNEYKLDILDIGDEEFIFLEQKIKEAEDKIKNYEQTLCWIWQKSEEDKDMLKNKFYQLMGINKEEFENWNKNQ
jgi:hypothetical protein